MSHGPHPSSNAEPGVLVPSTMSAQAPISIPMVSPTPPFNIHLDHAEMDFLKKKLSDSQERQKNILLEAGQPNPDVTIVAAMEQVLRE